MLCRRHFNAGFALLKPSWFRAVIISHEGMPAAAAVFANIVHRAKGPSIFVTAMESIHAVIKANAAPVVIFQVS